MELAENATRWLTWKLRRVFNTRRQTISPLLWKPGAIVSDPSPAFFKGLSEEDKKRVEFLREELKLMSRLTPLFPQRIDDDAWTTFLSCETRKQRYDHLIFLRKREQLREREKASKTSSDEPKERFPAKQLLNFNTARVEREERQASWCRVARSHIMKETPSLAVDCRFLGKISPRASQLTGLQLQYLISSNRNFRTPWPLYYVNFDEEAPNVPLLKKKHLSLVDSPSTSGPIVTKENYTALFPKEKIVYLSPHAEEELTDLQDADVLYVLGGIVDRVPEKGIHPHASRVTAEEDGVRCARLPLDQYVQWKSGTKYLTLVAVANILHDVHASGGDWPAAFARHIPVRNTRGAEEKNQMMRERHERIREFNRQLLAIVERRLPDDRR